MPGTTIFFSLGNYPYPVLTLHVLGGVDATYIWGIEWEGYCFPDPYDWLRDGCVNQSKPIK